jgi:hypothetical protein
MGNMLLLLPVLTGWLNNPADSLAQIYGAPMALCCRFSCAIRIFWCKIASPADLCRRIYNSITLNLNYRNRQSQCDEVLLIKNKRGIHTWLSPIIIAFAPYYLYRGTISTYGMLKIVHYIRRSKKRNVVYLQTDQLFIIFKG